MFSTYIKLAFDSLRRQKTRSLLTILAMSIGIMAVIVIMAAGQGMKSLILGQLDIFGADTFHLETRVPQSKNGFSSADITVTTLKDKDLEAVRKDPNIAAAGGELTGQEIVNYQGELKKVILYGQSYVTPDLQHFTMTSGAFFTKDDEDSLAQVVVLGSKVKQQLFGDSDPVSQTVYIKGKPFRVLGTVAPRGSAFFFDLDSIVIIPTKTMQKKLLGVDYYAAISGKFKDIKKAKETIADLNYILDENHTITDPDKRDFEIQTIQDAVSTLSTITSGITLLLVALVCISLIVGGVGIMNIMYVSVAERTFEIGLRKSLGARSKDVLWQFLIEAILITIGGGIVGVIAGALVALLIYFGATSFGLKWVFSIPPQAILLSVSFSALIGLIFGLYPAKKAASLSPIDALRQE
jgi:putative ABC transport system permease protein